MAQNEGSNRRVPNSRFRLSAIFFIQGYMLDIYKYYPLHLLLVEHFQYILCQHLHSKSPFPCRNEKRGEALCLAVRRTTYCGPLVVFSVSGRYGKFSTKITSGLQATASQGHVFLQIWEGSQERTSHRLSSASEESLLCMYMYVYIYIGLIRIAKCRLQICSESNSRQQLDGRLFTTGETPCLFASHRVVDRGWLLPG